MIGLLVSVPIACFRRGMAREFLETEDLPPPSTGYGFALSLVGEQDRTRHVGARLTTGIVGEPPRSTVLRSVWRWKVKTPGHSSNVRPDFQELLTGVRALVWIDSSEEPPDRGETLEARVAAALDPARRGRVTRFGGLSLGESTHMVDTVDFVERPPPGSRLFLLDEAGTHTLPVWVDHVGSRSTRYETGSLVDAAEAPKPDRLPIIQPPTPPEKRPAVAVRRKRASGARK